MIIDLTKSEAYRRHVRDFVAMGFKLHEARVKAEALL